MNRQLNRQLTPRSNCDRVFLGWDKPLLPAAIEYLAQREQASIDQARLDLGKTVCILPTAQSMLGFASLLREWAHDENLDYQPPQFKTGGDLAELLFQPDLPIAIEFEQTLTWSRVLQSRTPESLRPLLPILPDPGAFGPWMELAGTIRRLANDLESHGVKFVDVANQTETVAEKQRWELLADLHRSYLSELMKAGLSDQHEAARVAITNKTVQSQRELIFVGTSDLNESVARLIAELDTPLVALIAAPEEQAAGFDWLGRFKTEHFMSLELPLSDHHLIPAADVMDQATAVSEIVNEFQASFSADQISIGVTDSSHVAPIEMQMTGCDVATYRHEGWTVAATAVGRLIQLLAGLAARPSWRLLASFVRHADAHRYLQHRLTASMGEKAPEEFLTHLDMLLANHFPVGLTDPLPPEADQRYPIAIKVRDEVRMWLSPWLDHSVKRPIAQWCDELQQWLDSAYPESYLHHPDQLAARSLTIQALDKVSKLLQRFATLNEHLDAEITASVALETLASRLSELRAGNQKQPDQIPIHGWLDLALDPAPALVVNGLNHPFVPSAVTSDPFLPGNLRAELRVADNDRRFARDIYVMQVLLSSRKQLRFVVGKNAADGSPTPPSRLLSAGNPNDLATRVRMLLESPRKTLPTAHCWDKSLNETQLPIPQLNPSGCPVDSMSVTAFKSYLECPYRFYLRHVLKLKPVDDLSRELAANQFGDLVHGAVESFGESDDKHELDEAKIYQALLKHLHQYATSHYGDRVENAVGLQIHQAERRLQFVASAQAKRIAEGWTIKMTEKSVSRKTGAIIEVDGQKMGLSGRFDRIDFHPATGRWAILDYKTHGHKPEKKHLKKDPATGKMKWVDLQLPLYRMMIPFIGIDAPIQDVQLGYFNVSDKPEETKINLAEFSEELMDDATTLIHDCIRRILACQFDRSEERVQYDDYTMILQTGVVGEAEKSGAGMGDAEVAGGIV